MFSSWFGRATVNIEQRLLGQTRDQSAFLIKQVAGVHTAPISCHETFVSQFASADAVIPGRYGAGVRSCIELLRCG